MVSVDWRTWLLSAIARRLGLAIQFHADDGRGTHRAFLCATSLSVADEMTEMLCVEKANRAARVAVIRDAIMATESRSKSAGAVH